MPFADAKYPAANVTVGRNGDRQTQVPLANGETLLVIEQHEPGDALLLALADRDQPQCVSLYVCEISARGVLASAYSEDACDLLARRARDA